MALFPSSPGQQAGAGGAFKADIATELQHLRMQGLTGAQIVQELKAKGFHEGQIMAAIDKLDNGVGSAPSAPPMLSQGGSPGGFSSPPNMGSGPGASFPPASAPMHMAPSAPPMSGGASGQMPPDALYDRIEEIAEGLIDEKWDELIAEVKKIIAWKDKVEEENHKLKADIAKLKEDFKLLHEAVLGKVEEYDKRMQDVGVELKAVGKVFKDVVPVFTEQVKELKGITSGMREARK